MNAMNWRLLGGMMVGLLLLANGSPVAAQVAPAAKSGTTRASAPLPVTANFAASPSSGPAPLHVQFTETSTGDVMSRVWDFGDGSAASTERNPRHTYSKRGRFTARLTVTGTNGSSSRKSKSIKVQAPIVLANFTVASVAGAAPLTVQFTDASTGPVTNCLWTFGDGSSRSSERNPSHTYRSPGRFKASLRIVGEYGRISRKTQTITVPLSDAPLAVTNSIGNRLSNSPPGIVLANLQDTLPSSSTQAIMLSVSANDGTSAAGTDPFRFRIQGRANDVYVIQASPDLVNWTVIATNEAAADGTVLFSDSQARNFSQRFYRGVRLNVAAVGVRNGRILVKPKLGLDLSALHRTLGVQVLNTFSGIGNLQICQVPLTITADALILLYQQSGLVAYAEHDFTLHALVEPNDVRFTDGSLWNMHNLGQLGGVPDADIDAPEAWDTITNAGNVIVAVIDSGIRTTHEDLAPNLWTNPGETPGNGIDDDGSGFVDDLHGINTLNNSGSPEDDSGHGSHVSGILGGVGNNQVGVVGVCWKVQIMSCKFLDSHGDGSISDAIKCIDYARTKGARIINASWGSTTFTSQALEDAIVSARNADIIFVAACGNLGGNNDDPASAIFPASYDLGNIIAVAATTRTDALADFSNYGATKVDLAAPGTSIFSCWNNSDSAYQYFAGTSMAAAHVSGAAALLRAQYPNEGYLSIINRLLGGVDPVPALAGKCRTGGRLNVQKALGNVPSVSITATDANASESGDAGAFTVTRIGNTTASLVVNYSVNGGADNGADYQNLPGSVTIAAGSSSAIIAVTPIDDSTVETNETVVLTLSASAAYTVGSPGGATVTIADNDQTQPPTPTVTVTATDANASETGDTGTFTVSRTGSTDSSLAVNYSLSGSAQNGTDYQLLDTSVTIPAGSSSATISVAPIDDSTVETNETVVLTLSASATYTVGSPSGATVSIADNDQPTQLPTVTVTASDASASENGDAGTFTISRTGGTNALTVNYTLSGSAQNGTDYQPLDTTVTIPAGANSATVAVMPIDDSTVETNEMVMLTLGSGAAYNIGSPNSATVTIADNDQPTQLPTVTVTASDASASENGDAGTFTISRTGGTNALTVNYTLGGVAGNGTDYQQLGTSVTIPASANSVTVTVTPLDDSIVETNETVVLTLSDSAAYTAGSPSSAIVTIADNDQSPPPAPTVTVTATDANASEAGDTGAFTVNRTGSTASSLTVNYSVSGTAQNGSDYQQLFTSVTIPAGASSAMIVITPIDDSTVETNETVVLSLAANAAYTIGSPGSATVIIADNDQPPPPTPTVAVTATDGGASEAGDTGVFTVSRTGSTATALIASYTLSGTAQNGTDYQRLDASVTIPAGASSATVTVTPIDDSTVETNESVVFTLSAGAAYNVGSPSSATVIIADNDQPPPKPTVTVTATDANASESGDAGRFTVTRTGSSAAALTVSYALSGTAQNGADYQQLDTSVTLPAGSSSTTITVTTIDDSTVETNETVVLTLMDDQAYTVGSSGSATVTIADNDQPPPPKPTVTVTATDANASESGDTGRFTITRTGSTAAALTVNYAITGTAQNGADYQQLGMMVTIPAGAESATITVTPLDDSAVEGSESVVLTLAANAAYGIGSSDRATVTIADNDQAPRPLVSISITIAVISEGGGPATCTIRRTGSTSASLTVRYSLSGTAVNGADYEQLSGTAIIPAGADSVTIAVKPIDDRLIEPAELAVLTLEADASYEVNLSLNAAILTITDNDLLGL